MSQGRAVDGLGSTLNQRSGSATQGCSGRADIVDEQNTVAPHPAVGRKAPPRELHPLRPRSPSLPAEPVAAKRLDPRPVNGGGHLVREKAGGGRAAAESPKTVGWDRGDNGDLVKPGRETDPCTQTPAQWSGELVVAAMLEGQDRLPEDTVVLAPQDGAELWRR